MRAFGEDNRNRGVNRKGDGSSVFRNCFETCLMEGYCVIHDVMHQLQPADNVRTQASGGGRCE